MHHRALLSAVAALIAGAFGLPAAADAAVLTDAAGEQHPSGRCRRRRRLIVP